MTPLLPLGCPRAELQVTFLTPDFPLFSRSNALPLHSSPRCRVGILDPPRKAVLAQIPCRSGVAKSFRSYSLKMCLFSVSLHLCTDSPALALGKDRGSPTVLIRHVAALLSSAQRAPAASPWWTLPVETPSGHSFQSQPREPRQLAPARREGAGARGGTVHPAPGAAVTSLAPRKSFLRLLKVFDYFRA